ncbi:unnamed protein product [Staurois parvus]|uniref:Uncharacterized protein n=1 Tax=Staurois parvus TaxID=386267 RepID=A0ABN9FCU3_9NEOB|nr:unnamed protein product [Staurois parvus]
MWVRALPCTAGCYAKVTPICTGTDVV